MRRDLMQHPNKNVAASSRLNHWKCQLVADQQEGCSTASDLQLQLYSCCRFVGTRPLLK